MDELTKGTWIINSQKLLHSIGGDVADKYELDATDVSGKAGALLSRLAADREEVVPMAKVAAFAQSIGIGKNQIKIDPYLKILKEAGKIDIGTSGVEVYCFSSEDAVRTTSAIFDKQNPGDCEHANLLSLDATFHLPYEKNDLVNTLTMQGVKEETAKLTLDLQSTLNLVQVTSTPGRQIYFNEYTFAGKSEKIVAAVSSLKNDQQQTLREIQALVENSPGYPLDELEKKFSPTILQLMEGVGLLDGIPVKSQNHEAVFVCSPQLKGISLQETDPLWADVFHKAKILLSCLRFGQFKSRHYRGLISDPQMMLNIVNKLLRGEWVGPCTAIGHDYKELEIYGTIQTRIVKGDPFNRYEMQLRQKDVGKLVRDMLSYSRVMTPNGDSFDDLLGAEPVLNCQIPEFRRKNVNASMTGSVQQIRDQMIDSVRTGLGRL